MDNKSTAPKPPKMRDICEEGYGTYVFDGEKWQRQYAPCEAEWHKLKKEVAELRQIVQKSLGIDTENLEKPKVGQAAIDLERMTMDNDRP